MNVIRVEQTFAVLGSLNLDADTDRVMDELMLLVEADDRLSDADMSATLAEQIVTISVAVSASNFDAARELGDASIRAAIHAAGGATPSWAEAEPSNANSVRFEVKAEHLEVA